MKHRSLAKGFNCGAESRRDFLASLASLSLPLVAGAHIADNQPLKVGFLGIGYSHFKDKFALLRNTPQFDVVGLCEEDDTIRRSQSYDEPWLTRPELFKRAELIVVEGRVQDRVRDAQSALEAGRHVHLEKPPAPTLRAFRKLVELARARSLVLQVGYMWRYNPAMNLAIEAARNGWLGEIYLVRATMNTMADSKQRQEWAQFRGGAMFEQGCHLVDAIVLTLGRPRRVTPFLQQAAISSDALADNTVAVFEFAHALGIITSAPLQPNAGAHRFFEILGTRGTARVQPLEPPALSVDLAAAAGPYSKGPQSVPVPEYRRYVDEFKDIFKAVRTGAPLPVSLAQEMDVHEAVMRACGMD